MSSNPSAAVGTNVRAEMARRGVTQVQLAEQLGWTQPAVSKRLRGITPFDINELVRIAQILNVPLAALLSGATADQVAAS